MNKLLLAACGIALGAFALAGCAPSGPSDVSFTGTWTIVNENGITGAKDTQDFTVTTDGDGFRIEAQDATGNSITVYTGEMLHRKFVPAAAPPPPDSAGAPFTLPPAPAVQSEMISKMKTMPMRFWASPYIGKYGPGGQIAGQDTILYQAREKRPDGEFTEQAWVDAKTGIVLKSVSTIYSTQIDSMVNKITRECQKIQYGPVDKSAFAKP